MITGKKKMGRLARVIGVGLVQLTACAGEEAGQRQAEPAAGSAEQPILFPVSPLVPFEDVDLEGPTSFSYYTPAELLMMGLPPRRCDGVMSTHGRTYSVSLEGSVCTTAYFNLPGTDPSYDRPYINPNYHATYAGQLNSGSSLQLTLPPRKRRTTPEGVICANSNQDCVLPTPDRAEVSVYADGFEARDGVGFGFDDPKYFGFLMYFPGPPGFSLVSGYDGEGVHFMQAWQYHSSEADGCGVPLVATLENSNAANLPISPVQVRLTAHDQVDGFALANPPWPLTVNAWHRFVFFLDPNNGETEGLGQVKAWLDGHLYVDWHHDWGCNTRAAGSAHTDKWHLRVGMYRTSSGVVDQRLDMFFDNIRVAPSLGLAAAL